jgi:hypothetical protein
MATRKTTHHAEKAAAFDAALAAEQGTAPAETPAPEAAGAVVAPAAPPDPAAAGATASVAPAAAPVAPDWEARYNGIVSERDAMQRVFAEQATQLQGRFDSERAETQRQLDALRAETASERKLRQEQEAELVKLRRDKTFEVDFGSVENMTPEAARELTDKVMRPVLERMRSDYETRIADIERMSRERDERYANNFKHIDESTAERARVRTNQKLLAAHPDFQQLAASPEFARFKDQRIPGTRTTYGQEMARAYGDNDAEYVNETMALFKQTRIGAPSLAAVAGAPSGTAATTVATRPAAAPQKYSYEDLSKWRAQRRRGEITAAEEKRLVAAFKAAEGEGLVA